MYRQSPRINQFEIETSNDVAGPDISAEAEHVIVNTVSSLNVDSICRLSLLKVPKLLAQMWLESSKSSDILGTVRKSENGKKQLSVIYQDTTQHQMLDFEFEYKKNTNKDLYALGCQSVPNSSESYVSVLGEIKDTVVIKPIINRSYRSYLQSRLKSTLEPNHKTMLGAVETSYKNQFTDQTSYLFKYYTPYKDELMEDDDEDDYTTTKQQQGSLYKRPKLTTEQAKKAIFTLFESRGEKSGIRLKEFQHKINYPVASLRNLLQEIAEFKSIGSERPQWYLKPEFLSSRI